MGLLTVLNESLAEIWELWGWLPITLLLATSVGSPFNLADEAD
jgi:hypothetical protein